ncbi:MAG: glycoside hydrolase family 32 protein [Candidatus Gallimonas sp.]
MQKPTIHFAPEKNWMNDPNGTVYADGIYHLFYQYNPDGAEWGNIQWAYATSRDLVGWKREGLRLTPDRGAGEKYCFSGCAVRTEEGFKIFYTSIGEEPDAVQHHARQLICDADERFCGIRRNGAAIEAGIHGFPVSEWRDPFVFRFRGDAYMTLAGISDVGHIFLYRAKDASLNGWEYLGILFMPEETDDLPECPNVAVFGDRIALFYSLAKRNLVRYVVGTFDGRSLSVEDGGIVDHGTNCFYATNLATGAAGETVLFGWQRESLIGASSPDGTYSGCLALPRIVRLNGNRLEFSFTDGLKKLYRRALDCTQEAGKTVCRASVERVRIAFRAAGRAKAFVQKNKKERVTLDFDGDRLRIGRESLTENADERVLELPLRGDGAHDVELIFDGTIAEAIVDGEAVSFRFYRLGRAEIVFEQVGGAFLDVCATELNAADVR